MSKRIHQFSSLGIVLALLYLALAVYVFFQHYEGSWGGFLLFWASFPASLVTIILPYGKTGEIMLAAVGVLWWYAVGYYFQYRGRNPK